MSVKRVRPLSKTQEDVLLFLMRAGTIKDREGVITSTVGALERRELVSVYAIWRRTYNPYTERTSHRAGWILEITPAGEMIAQVIEERRDRERLAKARRDREAEGAA